MVRFLLRCSLPRAQVRVARSPHSYSPPPEAEPAIDATWRMLLDRPGVRLFDGPMCRLESFSFDGTSLHLTLGKTSYRQFAGTNLYNPHLARRFGTASLANPVGASVALESADGKLMLGRRNRSVAYYPDRIHPFAGALEERDGQDVFAAAERELSEELSLSPADLSDIRLSAIVEDLSLLHPELIFHARCRLDAPAILARVDRAEHDIGIAVEPTPEAADRALLDPALTPVCLAAVWVWGISRFGPAWNCDPQVKKRWVFPTDHGLTPGLTALHWPSQ